MPITVAHRSDGSGTTYIFTHYLAAVSPDWAKQSRQWEIRELAGRVGRLKGMKALPASLRKLPGSIGYIELAYAVQNKIPYALLRNKAGIFVEPTIASTTAAAAGAVAAMKKDVRVSIVNSAGKNAYPDRRFHLHSCLPHTTRQSERERTWSLSCTGP